MIQNLFSLGTRLAAVLQHERFTDLRLQPSAKAWRLIEEEAERLK